MSKESTLSANYCYVECLQTWFKFRVGKSPEEFEAFALKNGVRLEDYNVTRRVPLDTLARLWQAAEKEFFNPHIALEAATCRPSGNFGIPEVLMLYSRSMADALNCLKNYSRLIHDTVLCNFEIRGGKSVFEIAFLNGFHPFNRFAAELFFSLFCENTAQYLIGRPFRIRAVGVEGGTDEQLKMYSEFFKVPTIKVFKGFVVEFDEDLSQAMILGHNPDILPTLERSAKTELSLLPNPMNLVDKVIQELLRQMQGNGDYYISSVAKNLGYTVRSLQRHLQNYGTEFSAVLDFFRKENSQFLLQQGQSSVKEIASILGFKNLASFYRAYKRWYGRAPKGGTQVLRAGMGSQLTQEVSSRGTFVNSNKLDSDKAQEIPNISEKPNET